MHCHVNFKVKSLEMHLKHCIVPSSDKYSAESLDVKFLSEMQRHLINMNLQSFDGEPRNKMAKSCRKFLKKLILTIYVAWLKM